MEQGFKDPGQILRGGWRNVAADAVMQAASIHIIYSFNETLRMQNMHRNNGQGHECTHYCHPSAPQVG